MYVIAARLVRYQEVSNKFGIIKDFGLSMFMNILVLHAL